MAANDRQVAGIHYINQTIQTWDFITANKLPFLEGSIIKYIVRFREKGGITDLEKAAHYLEKLIEVEKGKMV